MPKSSRRALVQTAILAAATPLLRAAETSPGSALDDARKNLAESAKAVAAVPLPQAVEPAFTFRA